VATLFPWMPQSAWPLPLSKPIGYPDGCKMLPNGVEMAGNTMRSVALVALIAPARGRASKKSPISCTQATRVFCGSQSGRG